MLSTLRKLHAWTGMRISRFGRPVKIGAIGLAVALATSGNAFAQDDSALGTITSQGQSTLAAPPALKSATITYQSTLQRTGLNSNETAFIPNGTKANLNAGKFGKIWTRVVDGTIYAQPLFVPAVQFPNVGDILNSSQKNGVYNAVYVCTTHNSIYAFDAGGSASLTHLGSTNPAVRSAPLWHINFNSANADVGPVPLSDIISEELTPEIGIIGTPVISAQTDTTTGRASGTMFVVVKTKEGSNYAQRLHAIDIATGAERTDRGSPLLIQAGVLGTGDGSVTDSLNGNKPTVFFDPQWENQEAALSVAPGLIVVSWGSHGDNGPYHGWVMAFSSSKLKLVSAYNTSPNGDSSFLDFPAGAGIWQGGAGPALDEAGALYLATGAGQFDAEGGLSAGGTEFGNSVLKLKFSDPSKPLQDFFTPNNWLPLSENLLDLGSGGVVVLPNVGNTSTPRLAVAAGTEGTIYLLNRDTGHLGHFTVGADKVVQSIPNAVGPVFGLPAFFNNTLYFQGTSDVLKAFKFQNGLINPTPVAQSTRMFDFPGATPSVTSSPNGTNGVVWTVERFTPPPILAGFDLPDPTPYSVLHAYDAGDISKELFSSTMMGSRDLASTALYAPPTIANGRAYIGGVNEISAFGYFAANGVAPGHNQADHFIISGPQFISQKTGNWYSITAIGPDGNPIKLTGSVHLSYRFFGGATVNVNTLNFNNESNQLFQYAFMNSGLFEFFANDDYGHSTYVENIDLLPFGTLFPEIFVTIPETNGPDHLIVKCPSQAKVGSKITVQVTAVTATNAPYTFQMNGASAFVSAVGSQFTLPEGTQGAFPGFPVYAYLDGPGVTFRIGSPTTTLQMTVPSAGNHVLIISGTVLLEYGTTLTIGYSLNGTATLVGIP